MKFKLLPTPPGDLEFVADAHRAVPLVPGSEDDCCARLMRRLDLPSRDVARTWLTFLRGVRLARETESGFARIRRDVDRDALAADFRERQFGASEVLAVLADADGPLAAEEVFERFQERVPQWEHYKNPGTWKDVWSDRIADLLEWLVLLELAEREGGDGNGGYRLAEGIDAGTGDRD